MLDGFLGAIVSYRRDIDAIWFCGNGGSFCSCTCSCSCDDDNWFRISSSFWINRGRAIVIYRYSLNKPREARSLITALKLRMVCGIRFLLLAIIAEIFVRIRYNIFNILPILIIHLLFDVRHNFLLKATIPTVTTSIMIEEIDEILSQKTYSINLFPQKKKIRTRADSFTI